MGAKSPRVTPSAQDTVAAGESPAASPSPMKAPSGLAGIILNVVGWLDDLVNVKRASTPKVVQAALSDV